MWWLAVTLPLLSALRVGEGNSRDGGLTANPHTPSARQGSRGEGQGITIRYTP